jgi:hypothetical protein
MVGGSARCAVAAGGHACNGGGSEQDADALPAALVCWFSGLGCM